MTEELALFGGKPVRTRSFPKWPRFTKTIKESVINTLENDLWGVGSKAISTFERDFADYQDAKYCLSTNSGTSALWVALKAAGVSAGDEVILPSYTFIATASAVLMANAVPVFADVESETFNLDPELIEKAITSKTKVIMPVHIAGNPAQLDKILTIANQHGITVIEDAAQAHGAEWKRQRVGAIGLGGIFSFQTSKNMTAGEGGAIVSNNKEFIDACFSYHNCGRVKGGQWYEHQHLGGNFRLNSVAASILSAQIQVIDREMELREKNRLVLNRALADIPGIIPVESYAETTRVANHLYLLRYDKTKFNNLLRETFFKAMQAEGIFTYAGYVPLYREKLFITNPDEYPWLKDRNYQQMYYPVAEKLANEEAVWLKQNHLLGSQDDIQDIIDAFIKVTTVMKDQPELFR